MLIKDRTAVISGASRGIGLSIAQHLARKGANIVLLGRSRDTLEQARRSLPSSSCSLSTSQQHRTYAMDVSDPDAWSKMMTEGPTPSILVNAAGITHYSFLPRTPVSTIDAVVRTNLLGTLYGTRAFTKRLLLDLSRSRPSPSNSAEHDTGKEAGCIVNIASALGHRGGSGSSVYAATKAGVMGFSKSIAEELGPRGIRCNAVAPGYINTQMVAGMSEELTKAAIEHKVAARRMGTVEEVSHAVLFLIENEYANGSTLTLDGGTTYE